LDGIYFITIQVMEKVYRLNIFKNTKSTKIHKDPILKVYIQRHFNPLHLLHYHLVTRLQIVYFYIKSLIQ